MKHTDKPLNNLTIMGKFHFVNGVKIITNWVRKVCKDIGEWVRPKLKTFWNELTKDAAGLSNVKKSGFDFSSLNRGIKRDVKTEVSEADFDYSSFKRGGKRDLKAERKLIDDNMKEVYQTKTDHNLTKLNEKKEDTEKKKVIEIKTERTFQILKNNFKQIVLIVTIIIFLYQLYTLNKTLSDINNNLSAIRENIKISKK